MFAPWPGDGDLKLRAAAASGPVNPEARDDWKDEVLPWLSDELARPVAMKKKARLLGPGTG
jgi:hypothetical protein